jgi:hypothetical protein
MIHRRGFQASAFYVSERKRAKWIDESAEVLIARFRFLAEWPRLVVTWGTWRGQRQRRPKKDRG